MDRSAEVAYQRAAFAGKIVNAGFAGAADVGVWRQKSFRLPGRHRHVNEPVAEQTRTSHGEFAPRRNLNVIINLQWHIHALAFADHSRAARDFPDFGAREQDIGALEQSARVREANREWIISPEAFTEAAKLHNQRTDHR